MKHLLLTAILSVSTVASALERPPQFVMLAFDNCQENQTWSQVSKFLDDVNSSQKDRVRFTFFLSAVGLLSDRAKDAYIDPRGRSGKSNIDFGGKDLTVLERVTWINKLHDEGNEIASHAVGHFNGKDWTVDQWRHEFKQYEYILNNLISIHGWKGDDAKKGTLHFAAKDLKGFRAPYLEGGKALNQVLQENRYAYDTSNTDQGFEPTTWPKKFPNSINQEGLWNFGLSFVTHPLTQISEGDRERGLDRSLKSVKLPAMDYNFCYRQTGGCPDKDPYAQEADNDAKQMLQAYLKTFLTNYNGNRAPLHIGHHFQQHRGGSYNRALMAFAKAVCGQPEVRCATYSELTDFMNRTGAQNREQYQSGNFQHGAQLSLEDLTNQLKSR